MSSARKRAVLDDGELRDEQHGRDLGAAADFRAEQPQPRRGQQAGVQREQVVARGVHQPLGRPQLPADPAAHRVVALAQPDRQHPHPEHGQQRVRRHRGQRRDRRPQQCGQHRLAQRRAVADGPPDHRESGGQRHQRQRAQQQRGHAVDEDPERGPRRPVLGPWVARLAGLDRGRALPVLAVLHLADHTPSRARRRRPCRRPRRAAAWCARRRSRRCRSRSARGGTGRRRSSARTGRPRVRRSCGGPASGSP